MSTGTQKWAGANPDRLLPGPVVILYGRLSGGRCGPHPTETPPVARHAGRDGGVPGRPVGGDSAVV
ncbi:hypothetical protein [Micromonospora zamorensis]|uniref:hypothetical protein n=1 Tax=Micromonospora zamorensis TaxID=709883 RepID=UPI0033A3D163